MNNTIELATNTGFHFQKLELKNDDDLDVLHTVDLAYSERCFDRLLEAHRKQVIAELAEIDGAKRMLKHYSDHCNVDAAEHKALQARVSALESVVSVNQKELERLAPLVAELEADAGWYRAMRTASVKQDKAFIAELAKHDPRTADQFDAALDAARAKEVQ